MINLITLYVYTMSAFGLSYIVGYSVITQRPREWLYGKGLIPKFLVMLAECPACCGFWTGITAGLVLELPWWMVITAGLYTAATNRIIAAHTLED